MENPKSLGSNMGVATKMAREKEDLHGDLSKQERDTLILSLKRKVEIIATKIMSKLPTGGHGIELDDLISAGNVAVIHAVDTYNPNSGFKLESYSDKRINGAMIDYLRSVDFMSRDSRKNKKQMAEIVADLGMELNRTPTLSEIKERAIKILGWSVDKVDRALADSYTLDERGKGEDEDINILALLEDKTETPYETTKLGEIKALLLEARNSDYFDKNDTSLQVGFDILEAIYWDELNNKEIGRRFNVTESRISQQKNEALRALKDYLLHVKKIKTSHDLM
jgi:RNA polymerase sigma factor for flagellar operon FliA